MPQGHWNVARDGAKGESLSHEQREAIEQLKGISYLSGYRTAPGVKSVTIYDQEKAYDGLNLYLSGHAPAAILMDMEGNTLHEWHLEITDVWPHITPFKDPRGGAFYWRRAHLFENGDLLAIYDGHGLIKIDKDSNLIWSLRGGCHHDLFSTDDGKIYILSRQARIVPRINPDEPIVEDFITIIDAATEQSGSFSLLECFENSDYAYILGKKMGNYGDIFHTNTLDVLDGSHVDKSPAFKSGNILISVLRLDTIAVVDPKQKKVVWAALGDWKEQHEPQFLDNGNMLLFDNIGCEGKSKVIEFDPISLETVWEYKGNETTPLDSAEMGSCQRLPNGNTLITESLSGRALEVTPDKKVVWEFYNPHRAGEHHELIATLCDLIRLEPDFPLDWLESEAPQNAGRT